MRETKQLKNALATNHHQWSLATKRSHGVHLTLTQGQRDAIAKRQHHLVHTLICQETLVESPCTFAVHTQLLPRQLLALVHGVVDCQESAHPKEASVHNGLVQSQVAWLVDIQEDEVETGALAGQSLQHLLRLAD